jgi:hypothetical protein
MINVHQQGARVDEVEGPFWETIGTYIVRNDGEVGRRNRGYVVGLKISCGDVTVLSDPLAQPACHRPEPSADLQTMRAWLEPKALDSPN